MSKQTGQTGEPTQISITDLLQMVHESKESFSSKELESAIDKLRAWQARAKEREALEKRKREREERERKAREEQEKKEAHIREVTCMDLPLDWENVFHSDVRTQGVHAESASDALVLCLSALGKVDIEYMSSITGLTYKEVIGALRGSIYQNPQTWDECFYKGWETADEYLSGNLIRKWQAAKEAGRKYNGYFAENVKAIEAVLPPTVATKDIYVTLGSPWVPTDVIDAFIEHLFKRRVELWHNGENIYAVKHDEITGTWEIPNKTRYGHNVTSTKTYGTDSIEALYILERTLNMKSASVTREVPCLTNKSGKKRVIDKDETLLAMEKQQKMIAEFQKWVWKDEVRKERLESIFETQYSCVRRRIFDGKQPKLPTGTDAMYALCAAMTAYARDHKDDLRRIANSVSYADRMPPDFSTVLLKDYMHIEPDYRAKLLRIPEFSAWLSTKGRLLHGAV